VRLPAPEPGLVIRYSYLWLREHRQGREDGIKDRPCAIVLVVQGRDAATRVQVVTVTHSPPENPETALELPAAIKRHLDLDTERSWVVLSESNVFEWPGLDLHRVGDQDDSSVAYGFLPPRFFAELRRRFLALETAARSRRIRRTE
jgi:hypothetical protein